MVNCLFQLNSAVILSKDADKVADSNVPDQGRLFKASVVQSILSLTSSLRGQLVKCFTTL